MKNTGRSGLVGSARDLAAVNVFGCETLRLSVMDDHVFTHRGKTGDYDYHF